MKYTKLIVTLAAIFPLVSFAATEITQEDVDNGGYSLIGSFHQNQSPVPDGTHEKIMKKADQKCMHFFKKNHMDIATQCYYKIEDTAGKNTGYKDITVEVYNKK